jgi:hypothetical protein
LGGNLRTCACSGSAYSTRARTAHPGQGQTGSAPRRQQITSLTSAFGTLECPFLLITRLSRERPPLLRARGIGDIPPLSGTLSCAAPCLSRRGHNETMLHRSQPSTEGVPRAKPSGLPSLAIQSFASFQSQTSSPVPIAVQPSPIRRKPLPAESPVIGRFAAAQFSTRPAVVQDQDFSLPIQGARRVNNVLSPPLTEDELFVPRNLDE